MELSLLSDTVTVAAKNRLGFRPIANSTVYLFDPLFSDLAAGLQISSPIFDALAPPPVKQNQVRLRRAGVRKKSHTRRSCDGDGEDHGLFDFGDGDSFSGGSWGGGGGGGSGGKGWNYDRSEEQNWEEESSSWFSSSSLKFALAFIYEVIYWIAFSYCMHFAFKNTVRILVDWVADGEREDSCKVGPRRLINVLE